MSSGSEEREGRAALMARLDRFARGAGVETEKARGGQARRFTAWGRVIEFTVQENGLVRAAALVDEEVAAVSVKPVEWMEKLLLDACKEAPPAPTLAAQRMAVEARSLRAPAGQPGRLWRLRVTLGGTGRRTRGI